MPPSIPVFALDKEGDVTWKRKTLEDYEVVETYIGKDLEYMEYEQLIPELKVDKKAFFVTCDEYVTAEDGTTKTYTITVIKSKYGHAPLLDLKVKGYELSPEFEPDRYKYTVDVVGITVAIDHDHLSTSKAEIVKKKSLIFSYDLQYRYVFEVDSNTNKTDIEENTL